MFTVEILALETLEVDVFLLLTIFLLVVVVFVAVVNFLVTHAPHVRSLVGSLGRGF